MLDRAFVQAHAQYNRRLRDADALEKHIIQARAQAAAAEEFARSNLLEDRGEAYGELALPPGILLFEKQFTNSDMCVQIDIYLFL